MSVTITYPFDSAANYTFDNSKVQISGGSAELILIDNPSQTFTQDFAADTGFTYDAAKTEFSGGDLQQVDQSPTDSTCWATYTTSIDLSGADGSVTGTATGGAAVVSNQLDLAHDDLRYVDYDGTSNGQLVDVGAIKFKATPNYSGTPSTTQVFFSMSEGAGSFNNLIQVNHLNDGNLKILVYNSSGTAILNPSLGIWNPTSGVTYEFELNFKTSATGASRLFVDGVQFGSTDTSTGTRTNSIDLIRVGSTPTASRTSNFYIEDFIIFDAVQHTANYTPGYTLEEAKYIADLITLPIFTYSGLGSLQSFDTFVSTESGSLLWNVNGQYWDGGGWSVSDDSAGQMNSYSDINTNIGTLSAIPTLTVKTRTINSNTQQSISNLDSNYTGQIYPVDNPTVEIAQTLRAEQLLDFTAQDTISGSDEIKYILKNGDDWYYWDGAAWSVSNETYAQSNTGTEIDTNISSFTSTPSTVSWRLFLHSNDGSTTPSIQQMDITYDFVGETIDDIYINSVYFYAINPDGTICTDVVTATLSAEKVTYKDNVELCGLTISATPNTTTGYVEIDLISNVNMVNNAAPGDVTYNIIRNSIVIAEIYVPEQPGSLLKDIRV